MGLNRSPGVCSAPAAQDGSARSGEGDPPHGLTGCIWRMPPCDLPPPSTVQRCFCEWRDRGLRQGISNILVMAARELDGREASPMAGVIRWPAGDCLQSPRGDSQSAKTTESGGVGGFGAPLDECSIRSPGDGQADQGAQAPRAHRHAGAAGQPGRPSRRSAGPPLPASARKPPPGSGWVVERTFAWLGRRRRLVRDQERSIASAGAWVFVANIRLLTRSLARYCLASQTSGSGAQNPKRSRCAFFHSSERITASNSGIRHLFLSPKRFAWLF